MTITRSRHLDPESEHQGQRHLLWLGLTTFALLLPLLNKAFHIDDPLFLWTAEQIAVSPADFFGFEVNWYGVVEAMHAVTKNPPLVGYYLAVVAAIGGGSEIALHLGMSIPAIALAIGMAVLARSFTPNSTIAAGVVILTPVFAVSATSLMSDVTMSALWCWALIFFIRGFESDRLVHFCIAGLLMGLCALAKYFGLALLPLSILYAVTRVRGPGRWIVALALAFAIIAAFDLYTYARYGLNPLFDVMGYDRLPVLGVEGSQQVEDLVARLAVEISGRLVTEQQRRVGDDGPGDADSLLLAAGELSRVVLRAVGEAHDGQRRRHVLPAFGSLQVGQQQGNLDVALRGEHGEEVVELEHEAHVPGTPPREAAPRELLDRLSGDLDRALGGAVQTAQQVEQGSSCPTPEGPISARKSPRGISRSRPCRTSIRSDPRVKHLVQVASLHQLAVPAHRRLLRRYDRAVRQLLRTLDHHTVAGGDAGRHLHVVPVLESDRDRPALDRRATQHEHDRLTAVASNSRRGYPETRGLDGFHRLVDLEERDPDPHVRKDPRVEPVKPDANQHRRPLAVGGWNRRDDARRDLPVGICVECRHDTLSVSTHD